MFVTTLSAPWNPLSASVRIHLLTGSSQRVALLFVHLRPFPPLSRSILRFSVLLCLALLEREREREREREFNQLQRQRTIIRLPLDEVQRPDLPSLPPSPSASRSLFSGSFFLPRRAGFSPSNGVSQNFPGFFKSLCFLRSSIREAMGRGSEEEWGCVEPHGGEITRQAGNLKLIGASLGSPCARCPSGRHD